MVINIIVCIYIYIMVVIMVYNLLVRAFYVGLMDGLLGVAGMMTSYELVMTWIIPEHSLRKTTQQ